MCLLFLCVDCNTCNKFIYPLRERHKERTKRKYCDDTSTHPKLDEDAHRYRVGEANRGIWCGLGFTTRGALWLLGSQGGSARGSRSSQSINRCLTPHNVVAQIIDPDLMRRLEVIEEHLQPRSTALHLTHPRTIAPEIIIAKIGIKIRIWIGFRGN